MPPGATATDSVRSLDFDHARVTGSLLPDSEVRVEISYRETVVDEPDLARIGSPSYDDFEILTMRVAEMAAEKLGALAQRTRTTDLADLAELLTHAEVRDEDIACLAAHKTAEPLTPGWWPADDRRGELLHLPSSTAQSAGPVAPT